MNTEEKQQLLVSEMDELMRSLRKCDTQATAIAWMTRAYNAMDGAIRAIGDLNRMVREESSKQRGLIFQLPAPKVEIFQSIPKTIVHRHESKKPTYAHNGQMVVYPDFFMHPGLKPLPRAVLYAAAKIGGRTP